MSADLHKALLEGLAPGRAMWLKAGGVSLWPLLLPGDSLRVLRCDAAALRRGDVAVVEQADGRLIAHVVVETSPVRTAALNGVVDAAPKVALGRVTGVRRAGVAVPLPRASALLLRAMPATSRALRRLPFARRLVHRLRDGRR